jgi:recombination protein RecR
MSQFSPIIEDLIQSLRTLPGVGPKSAQRMALNLLERNKHNAGVLARSILTALENVRHCETCQMLTDSTHCNICQNPGRNNGSLCVVESPADLFAIEQTAQFRGRYFVLKGHLSPLDGIGPDDIGIPILLNHCQNQTIQEMILATNPTVEGEATAQYISNHITNKNIRISRIAHGVPIGSELEYLDGNTLSQALIARKTLHEEI